MNLGGMREPWLYPLWVAAYETAVWYGLKAVWAVRAVRHIYAGWVNRAVQDR